MQIVFDVGGTSMRVARVEGGLLTAPLKRPTPEDPEEGFAQLKALIAEAAADRSIASIAGGIPGIADLEGRILSAPNLPLWKGFPLGARLKEEHAAQVYVRHDADLAGLGEAVFGAGKGFNIVAYAGIGTGIGTARIVGGRPDSFLFSPEAGHQILDINSGSTLEKMVGGLAVSRKFGVHPRDVPRNAYDDMTPALAAGLYNTILHWSPDVFVLGGSMMNEDNGFRLGDIVAAMKKLPQFHPRLPEFKTAHLKDNAGLEGARALLSSL